MGFVAEEYRAAPLSDEKARKCCLKVSCCTLGRRKVWVSLPKSPIHPYVILPCTFRQRKWAEVSPESVVLHSRATKMRDSVAQACRAALSGDEEALKCRSSVPRCTLERQKGAELLLKRAVLHPRATKSVGFVAEESLHPYVIQPYTHGQQKWAEVSPESVVLYPRATKKRESVTQECRAALSGDEKCGFRCRRVRSSLRHSALHLSATKMG